MLVSAYRDPASVTVASFAVTVFALAKASVWVLSSTAVASSTISISVSDLFSEPSTSSACCMVRELRSSASATS